MVTPCQFLAALRTIDGPPMSMCSMASSRVTSGLNGIAKVRTFSFSPNLFSLFFAFFQKKANGAKLLCAFGEATVPKVTVELRKSYGGSYIVMNSKHLRADLVYAWPSAQIAVMGADGAVNVLYAKEMKAAEDPAEKEAIRAQKKAEYEELFSNPYQAAEKGYIDDVIEPRNTRFRIIRALESLAGKKQPMPAKKHDNLPL